MPRSFAAGALLALAACTGFASSQDANVAVDPATPDPLELQIEEPPPGFFDGWTVAADVGLNGSSGNSESLNIFANGVLERETERLLTRFTARYRLETDDGDETANRFIARARNDWLLPESPWRYFARGQFELDEFQEFDQRVSIGGGVGYEVIDNDRTLFVLRAGAQATREFGGEPDRWVPEGILGFDLEHKFTEKTDFNWHFDLYPALDRIGPYRFETDAHLRVLLDEEIGLYFKLGIEDRYDSRPNEGDRRNDLDYYATVGIEF
ncbi:MAG: DUF481 domain-containing protein [Planctomycetota bacterium]